MRIQFIHQSLVLTGGTRVVFEHARGLRRKGHEVTLLAPRLRLPASGPAPLPRWKHYLYERWSGRVEDGLREYGLADAVMRFDPARPDIAPAADVTIATAWETAEWLADMPSRVGTRDYLIQGYEAWTEDVRERVDRTWRLPFRRIVIAGWLERLARERFGETVWARIRNGVDAERFRPAASPASRPPVVGMLYDVSPWKGATDGVDALWRIHARRPETRFVLFGRARLRHRLPPHTRYVRDPQQSRLPDVYRSMDVFVNSSHSEGFSLVILEAMASGCALVATAVGETPEMGRPDHDYLMTPPRDPAALAEAVLTLLDDSDRRRSVATAGLALARRHDWPSATEALEQALLREPR
jgi:glycosyltransferase involved in cell wall biosynthesis